MEHYLEGSKLLTYTNIGLILRGVIDTIGQGVGSLAKVRCPNILEFLQFLKFFFTIFSLLAFFRNKFTPTCIVQKVVKFETLL